MKPTEFNAIRNAQGLRVALSHALTRFDRLEEAKAIENPKRNSHNVYALGIYLRRLDDVMEEIEAGSSLARALYDNFNDRLLTFMEKTAGLPITYGGGRADKGRPD